MPKAALSLSLSLLSQSIFCSCRDTTLESRVRHAGIYLKSWAWQHSRGWTHNIDIFFMILAELFRWVPRFVNSLTMSNCSSHFSVLWRSTTSEENSNQSLLVMTVHHKWSVYMKSFVLKSHLIPWKSPLWRVMTTANLLTTARILNSLRETSLFLRISIGGKRYQNGRVALAELWDHRAWRNSRIQKSD